MKTLPLASLPLLLAACGGSGDTAAGGNAAAPAALTQVQQQVVGMNDGQRRGVLLRAIVDGGEDCQGVTRAKRLPDNEGRPTWAARCGNGSAYQVAVGPDGVARVTQLPDAADV